MGRVPYKSAKDGVGTLSSVATAFNYMYKKERPCVFTHTQQDKHCSIVPGPYPACCICSTCTLGVSGNEARTITYHGVASPRQLLVVKNSCLKHATVSMIYKVSTTTLATSVSTL